MQVSVKKCAYSDLQTTYVDADEVKSPNYIKGPFVLHQVQEDSVLIYTVTSSLRYEKGCELRQER